MGRGEFRIPFTIVSSAEKAQKEYKENNLVNRKITYKLNQQETKACLKFAADMNMELNQLAKKSLFYALTAAYRTAEGKSGTDTTSGVSRQNEVITDEARTAVTTSDTEVTPISEDATRSVLAQEETNANPTE